MNFKKITLLFFLTFLCNKFAINEILTCNNVSKIDIDKIYMQHIDNIKQFEGLYLHNYLCSNKHATIGYGCLSNNLKVITLKQADSLLFSRYNQSIYYSKFHFKELSERQHLAAGQLIFQLGIGTVLKYKFIEKKQMNFSKLIEYCYNRRMFINRLFIYNQFNKE